MTDEIDPMESAFLRVKDIYLEKAAFLLDNGYETENIEVETLAKRIFIAHQVDKSGTADNEPRLMQKTLNDDGTI